MSDTVRKHKEFLVPVVATYDKEPLALVRGEGMYVWDELGDKYLDCFGGVLTISVGHANPAVVKAEAEQLGRLSHTSTLYANHNHADLAEKMAEITPGHLKKSFFTSTGTEAETKACSLWWGMVEDLQAWSSPATSSTPPLGAVPA